MTGLICRATVREGSHRELLENKKSVQAQDGDRKISEVVSSRPGGDNQSVPAGPEQRLPRETGNGLERRTWHCQSQRQRNGLNGLWR